jgi:hypothetical protein
MEAEQSQSTTPDARTPSEWATKLRESSKAPASSSEDQQDKDTPTEPLENELETETEEVEEQGELESEQLESEEEQGESELEADEGEEAELAPSNEVTAEAMFIVDGQEVSGQDLLNGLAATKHFSQEKHQLRQEAQVEREQLKSEQGNWAKAAEFMMGLNKDAFHGLEQQLAQTQDPQEFRQLKHQQQQAVQAHDQLLKDFERYKKQVGTESDKQAQQSINILRDEFGTDGWPKRYSELRGVAKEYGFEEGEFNKITDHRMMKLLHELDSKKTKLSDIDSLAKKKVANPVKEKRKRNAQRVNTLQSKKVSTAKDRFAKSHKPSDAAAFWLEANKKIKRN